MPLWDAVDMPKLQKMRAQHFLNVKLSANSDVKTQAPSSIFGHIQV